MLACVVDTNVFISALLNEGHCRAITHDWLSNKFQLVISNDLLNELIFTLHKPKFTKSLLASENALLISAIKMRARFVDPQLKITASRDKTDDPFLSCALEARANFIISGDKDLLILSPFQSGATSIEIIPPREFLKRLKARRI